MDAGAASKRRKLKREHLPSGEAGEYSPVAPPPPPLGVSAQSYEGRDRGERKGAMIQRAGYLDEPNLRIHGKEVAGKMTRREADQYPQINFHDIMHNIHLSKKKESIMHIFIYMCK